MILTNAAPKFFNNDHRTEPGLLRKSQQFLGEKGPSLIKEHTCKYSRNSFQWIFITIRILNSLCWGEAIGNAAVPGLTGPPRCLRAEDQAPWRDQPGKCSEPADPSDRWPGFADPWKLYLVFPLHTNVIIRHNSQKILLQEEDESYHTRLWWFLKM